MKKILLALLASTAVGTAAMAQEFPDVPAGSYAEEAVARLADLGIVLGFPDGTFRGNDAFTRYQAALVVSRLLDVVDAEMLTDADLDTVRNALQELASDVAANEQAVSDLQAAIDGAAGADEGAVEELQAELDALTVELDTLTAAQGAAAGLEQQVAANTDQVGQLSDLIGILNEDIAALSVTGEVDTGFLDDIEQNRTDIANLREFVVLLRRDQVGVTERVATIEESDTAQNAQLEDLTTRVSALEESQVAFGGSIGLEYSVGRLSGEEIPFDVDRIFGVGYKREQPITTFSGVFQDPTEDLNDDNDEEDAGEEARDRQDIEFAKGDFAPVLELNIDFSSQTGIAPESGLNTFDASVALELSEGTILDPDADVDGDADGPFDFADPDNYFDGYVFEFNSFEATLGPIGAEPLTFFYGEEPGAEFTDYVFESLGSGFRADVGTPDFLAFLQPTLQIAYGVVEDGGEADDNTIEIPDPGKELLSLDGTPVPNVFTDAYYRGIRGTLNLFSGSGAGAAPAPAETAESVEGTLEAAGDVAAEVVDGVSEEVADDVEGTLDAAGEAAGEAVETASETTSGGFLSSTGGFSMTGGFSVAQLSGNADEHADAAEDNADITVYGLDGQVNLSILSLEFEYAQNNIDDNVYFQAGDDVLTGDVGGEDVPVNFDGGAVEDEADEIPVALARGDVAGAVPGSNSLVYAELTVDTEAAGIPLLSSLSANYRDIPEFWYGMKYDEDTYPWKLDQTGFGAEATLGLSIFNLTGFFDSYSVADSNLTEDAIGADGTPVVGSDVVAYGVRAGAEVIRAVEVFGFYTIATLNGEQVFDLDGTDGNAERNGEYLPGYGIGVEHDGEAENALVPGLDFSVAYDFQNRKFNATNAEAELALGFLTLSPYVSYTIDDSPALLDDDVVALEAGTGIVTEPLDVIFQPSFAANVNYRNADHTDVEDVGTYNANYLQYSVGINFNQFLFENSTFGIRYGSFTAENVEVEPNLNGADDFASDISDGDQPATGTQSTNGYEFVWNYYGLEFGYGVYSNTNPTTSPNPGETGGQAFSVAYTVNF